MNEQIRKEFVPVPEKAVEWLKEKYPELCIKAGMCERIGGKLYTKTIAQDQSAHARYADRESEPFGYLIYDHNENTEDFTRTKPEQINPEHEEVFAVYLNPPAQPKVPTSDIDAFIAEIQQDIKQGELQTADLYLQGLRIYLSAQEIASKATAVPEIEQLIEWAQGWREYDFDEASTEERILYGACRGIRQAMLSAQENNK